eukprot:1323750-Amorphochlora_amoeboformis.AAC.1
MDYYRVGPLRSQYHQALCRARSSSSWMSSTPRQRMAQNGADSASGSPIVVKAPERAVKDSSDIWRGRYMPV